MLFPFLKEKDSERSGEKRQEADEKDRQNYTLKIQSVCDLMANNRPHGTKVDSTANKKLVISFQDH